MLLPLHIITLVFLCTTTFVGGMEIPDKLQREELKAKLKTANSDSKIKAMFRYTYANDIEMMEFLLNNGVNVNYKNLFDIMPFHIASTNHNRETMRLLINHGADTTTLKPQIHPLFEVVEKGDEEMVNFWLENVKISPNLKTQNDTTPLYIASREGHYAIVDRLLRAGAYPHCPRISGWTPLHAVTYYGYTNVAQLLLLQATIDVDHRIIKSGRTAIYWASALGRIDIVKMLIAKKANVNLTDNEGNSPLTVAFDNGFLDIAILLIDNGADIDHKIKNGHTPIHLASGRGHIDIVKMLIAKKANVNIPSLKGYSPLTAALDTGFPEIAILLINEGADVNQKAMENEYTPFILASYHGMNEVVKLLLKRGANIHHAIKVDSDFYSFKKGDTALSIARKKKHTEIVELIVKHMEAQNPGSTKATDLLQIQSQDADKKDDDDNCIIS